MDKLKGQSWSLDFIIMSISLLVILFAYIYTWNFITLRWNNIAEYNRQYLTGLAIAEKLVTTSGNPSNWEYINTTNQNNIISLGLVHERNEVVMQKLLQLQNMSLQNYSLFKEKLGAPKHQVYINVSNLARTQTMYILGNATPTLNDTVTFERMILFNSSVAILRVEVWK